MYRSFRLSWLIIGLILFAAFGPLFWLVPSRRDRRLAKMRSRARALGIQVEVTQLPDVDAPASARVTAGGRRLAPMVSCAAYRLALPRAARAAPQWQLLHGGAESNGPLPGWQWDSPPVGDAQYWERVGAIIAALPADTLACSAQTTAVACWWRENTPAENAENSVDSLHAMLAKLAELQRVTDAANRAEDDDDEGLEGPASER
jgi:hypothetical protein